MRRLLPVLVLCAAAAGCEPAWSVQGHVQSDAGAAIAASAALRCPGEPDLLTGTDHEGVFELGGNGAGPSLACLVVVAAPGQASSAISLRDVCEDVVGDRCSVAVLEVPLSAPVAAR